MADFDYDLFVIGGGSGGVRAARVAAGETGAKVAIAEESRYGGTCVIRGCVPKKLMVFASGYGTMAGEAREYGWEFSEATFDWGTFRPRLEAELDRLEGVYQRLLDGSGVERFDQRATLADAHTVELADGTRKTAKHILIATGGPGSRMPSLASSATTSSISTRCRNPFSSSAAAISPANSPGSWPGWAPRRRSITVARRSCAASTTRRAA